MVLKHGANQYSSHVQTKVQASSQGDHNTAPIDAGPMTVKLPPGDTQSAQSLKADSDEMAPNMAIGVEIGTGIEPMNTISNTNIAIGRLDALHQHAYSPKLTERAASGNRREAEHDDIVAPGDDYLHPSSARPHDPAGRDLKDFPNLAHSFVTGSQLSYFCPKRFNRFPRFTIFFKKGETKQESSYED